MKLVNFSYQEGYVFKFSFENGETTQADLSDLLKPHIGTIQLDTARIDETGTNINASPILDAIFISSGSDPLYFYNNTVYVGGSYSGTATRDQMCFRDSSTRPMVLKNNIFVNTRALTTPGRVTPALYFFPSSIMVVLLLC